MLGEQAQIFREIAGREGERDIGHRQHHVLGAAAGLSVDRGRQQDGGESDNAAESVCGHGSVSCDQWCQAMMVAPAKLCNRD